MNKLVKSNEYNLLEYVIPKPTTYFGGQETTNNILVKLTTTSSECAESCKNRGGPCSSKATVESIAKYIRAVHSGDIDPALKTERIKRKPEKRESLLPTTSNPESKIIIEAAKILKCDSESCILKHPSFQQFVGPYSIRKIGKDLETNFKEHGPRDTTALLSNFNHEGVLRRWAEIFPKFYPYRFCMIDFYLTGGSLARIDPCDILKGKVSINLGRHCTVKRKCTTHACVINTDVSSGPGKHWVCVFTDCRPSDPTVAWTVEYFNSAGNPPPRSVVKWMEETCLQLEVYRSKRGGGTVKSIPVTSLRHQKSRTECGPYALFYIRSRLDGIPYTHFTDYEIPDKVMIKFRTHLFRRH